jgi:ribosomal protein S8
MSISSKEIPLTNFKRIIKAFLERRGYIKDIDFIDHIGITKIEKEENYQNSFVIFCIRPYMLNKIKKEITDLVKDNLNIEINLTIIESDLWLNL